MTQYVIHTDGGARGNPGPAAAGVVIEGPDPAIAGRKKELGEYLGQATNNVAEYKAVLLGLKKLKSLIGSEKAGQAQVEVIADSELLIKQVNGEYKIKEVELQKLFVELWNARLDFGKVNFSHVMRKDNTNADKIVNDILDRENSKLDL